jgi:glycosyltransferase involved in cell wall biosynthesis
MKISIIIPCRNEKSHIREFLDSVLAQELDPGWELEILLADGMSNDGTREIVRGYMERAANVFLVDNPGRIVSTGLNAAIAASNGEVIIRMDAHTVYAPDYIRECVRVLNETGADMVGGPGVAKGRGCIGEAIAAAFHAPFCVGGPKHHDANYEGEVEIAYLGCWRRSIFERVGLFDPDLVRNQDDEFAFRLRRAGGIAWQSPRIKSSYTPRASLGRLFRQYLQYGFWRVVVIRKHRALASWRHLVPTLFVTWILLSGALIGLCAVAGLTPVSSSIAIALAVGLSVYAAGCVITALGFARSVHPRVVLLLPVVIAVYHVAYGLGFLLGVFKYALSGSRLRMPDELFSSLTR